MVSVSVPQLLRLSIELVAFLGWIAPGRQTGGPAGRCNIFTAVFIFLFPGRAVPG